MKKCKAGCNRKFPDVFINKFFSGEKAVDACPICALRLRNSAVGLPSETPFTGTTAKRLYDDCVKWVKRKHSKKYN